MKPSETLRSHTSYYGQKIYDKGLRLNKKKKREAQKESSSLSDYDRTLRKSIEEEKKKEKRARKDVAQLGEQSKQSVPH